MSARRIIYGWLCVLLLLWSTNFIFARYALNELPVSLVLSFRYVFSAACMIPVVWWGRRQPDWREHAFKWSDAPAIVAVGLLGLVGNQVLFVIGISQTSVAHAGLITALSPVLVLLGSAAMGIERITPIRIAGLLTAACGVVVLQFSRGATGGATRRGDAIMLVSVIVFAAFNLLGKPLAERAGSMRMNAISYGAAGIIALPFSLATMKYGAHASLLAWLGVVYMAVGSSVAGYLIYAHALRHLPASRVTTVVYLQPLLVCILAILVLGERPGSAFIPAGGLILAGVYLAEKRSQ